MPEQSYSATEAADALGVSPPTAKKMVRDRKLRGWRTPGGHLRVSAESVRQFLEGGDTKETQHRGEPSGVLQNRRERVEEINLGNQELRATRDANKLRKEIADDAERDRQEDERIAQQQRQEDEKKWREQERQDHDREDRVREKQEERRDKEKNQLERERRDKELQDAIAEAEKCLPIWATCLIPSLGTPTSWEIKLRRRVREALAKLSKHASKEEICDTAIEVGQAVAQEYEEEKAAEDRKQSRERAQQGMKTDAEIALWHVSNHLDQLEQDGDFTFDDKYRLIEKLKKRILPELLEEIRAEPDMSREDKHELVEDLVDEFLPEFVEEEN